MPETGRSGISRYSPVTQLEIELEVELVRFILLCDYGQNAQGQRCLLVSCLVKVFVSCLVKVFVSLCMQKVHIPCCFVEITELQLISCNCASAHNHAFAGLPL